VAEAHLSLLLEMIELLERYAQSVTRASLEADRETWLKVKAALELAVQCAIDLALAIVAARGLGTPQTYREAFALLTRARVVDASLAGELESWAGLRNVLVHIYTALDLDKLHAALGHVQSLRAFHAIAAREMATTGI
jgi:uncharacterized protein YutE (UPF0331/DUF86 family)